MGTLMGVTPAETKSLLMVTREITQSQSKDSSAADSVSDYEITNGSGCGGLPKMTTIGIISLLFLIMNIQR